MNSYLLPTLNLGPVVVERLIRQIPRHLWDHAIDPDRFTPREVCAHLADWELILRDRIRTAVEQPGTTLQVFDETKMAFDHHYADLDPQEQCALFARERSKTTEFARFLTSEEWAGFAHHPERGRQSVEDLANLLLGHDLYHIEPLTAYLR
jgi:hypothetical protein